MIPIADESPKGYLPFVNYLLIAANVLVFFLLQQNNETFYNYANMTGGDEGGVAWFAHIGGFMAGLLPIKIFEKFPKR